MQSDLYDHQDGKSSEEKHSLLAPGTQPPLTAETVAQPPLTAETAMADEHEPSELVVTPDKPPPAVMKVPPHSPQHILDAAHHSPLSSAPQRCHSVSFCQSSIQFASPENDDTSDDQLCLQLMVVSEEESQRGDEGTTELVLSK